MSQQLGLPGFDATTLAEPAKRARGKMSDKTMEKAAAKPAAPLFTMDDVKRIVEAKADEDRANILTVGGTKGGGHKTSTAVNLATIAAQVLDLDVLLVDTDDRQKTTTRHFERRERLGHSMENLTVISLADEAVRPNILKMAGKYGLVIVDCGGFDSVALRAAISISDRMVVPVAPKTYDYEAAAQAAQVIANNRLPALRAFCVLSGAYPGAAQENEEFFEGLSKVKVWEMVPTYIRHRRIWDRAPREGLAVHEVKQADKTAIDEIARLAALVL